MRILLVNPTYPKTFWSFNRVLELLDKRAVQPPLALITLAALLPQNWEFNLADLVIRDMTEEDWHGSEIVMITGLVNQYSGIMSLIREGKARNKTVVVGGPWAFHFPDVALDAGADIVVKGEVEPVMTDLTEAITTGRTGIILEAEEKPCLKDLPVPRFDLLDLNQYVDMAIQFSRGCPYQCEFCDITLMLGRKVRCKAPHQVLAELQALYDLGWRRGVFVVDDNFIGSVSEARALLKELCPWMEARGHPFDFNTQASVNLAACPDVMEDMYRAGFWKVFLGIETTDKENLLQIGKRQNAVVSLEEVCEKVNKAGLQIIAGCIIGFDGERSGAGKLLIAFSERTKIPEMFTTLLQAGPGTDMWKRLEREGRLLENPIDDNLGSQTAGMNFIPTRPESEIVDEFVDLYNQLYEPASYMERCYSYYTSMENPPPKKRDARITISELKAVLRVIWRQGIVRPSRWLFWKYVIAFVLNCPQQITRYFSTFVLAEHYYEYRHTISSVHSRRRIETERSAPTAD
ncbi:B12-binding domain-containing radical SAM protein [Thermodesulfobacteriota bacterium]